MKRRSIITIEKQIQEELETLRKRLGEIDDNQARLRFVISGLERALEIVQRGPAESERSGDVLRLQGGKSA